jgi:hypothetical protein
LERKFGFWESIVISIILTPVALFLALVSAGSGHGNYLVAKLLFPYTMLSTVVAGEISLIFLVLAFLQFPIYGFILALGAQAEKMKSVAYTIAAIHVFGVLLCFLLVSENFS